MSNKQLVLDAFDGKEVPYVPTGFWRPWLKPSEELVDGTVHQEFVDSVIVHHKQFIREFSPDIVKIMTAGFFTYPNFVGLDIFDTNAVNKVKPLDQNHKWFTEQVRLTKELAGELGDSGVLLYSFFAPFTFLRLSLTVDQLTVSENDILELIDRRPDDFVHLMQVITEDLKKLAVLVSQAGADGIYFCVQNLLTPQATKKYYEKYFVPFELEVLDAVNQAAGYNMLHICGNNRRNDFSIYQKYNAKVYNWATANEGLSLADGKKLFPGKTVLGGFSNAPDSLLYRGTEQEIKEQTRKILQETGTRGVILGADCAIHPGLDNRNLTWVRQQARSIGG